MSAYGNKAKAGKEASQDPTLTDPPPKRRKATVSVENTSASAADKSSTVEDTQLINSRIPEKEHSAIEGDKDKGPGNENGNAPLSAAESAEGSGVKEKTKSSRACPPWGDLEDEEEMKSSEPPKIDGEASLLPALHAEGSQSLNRDPMQAISSRMEEKRLL